MTTTTADVSAPSRTPLLAALGIAGSSLLTAVGTFWAINNTSSDDSGVRAWLVTVGVIAVAAALVYGLVVRTAATGNPGRRAVVLGVLALASNAFFFFGLPVVLASAAVACALARKDRAGSFGTSGGAALALSAVASVAATSLAVFG